jgi:folate-binding protein YgfZ
MSNQDQSAAIVHLDDMTSLHVAGEDATKFLHAQFTNDLANLPVNQWQYTGYCTPKGRLLSFMMIARTGDNNYRLIMPADVADSILPRLRMFVMRDDVTIVVQDNERGITGILADPTTLKEHGLDCEPEPGHLKALPGDSLLMTLDSEPGRYLYLSGRDQISKISLPATDRDMWTGLDISAGIPAVVTATQEAFVPQMVNLDLIGAVNFKKGCYPGQEVVARVHYLGKIKQRMYQANCSGSTPANPGDKLYIAGEEEKAAGTVVQSAMHDSKQILQVVLQTSAYEESADIRLSSHDGEAISFPEQPYSVNTENN